MMEKTDVKGSHKIFNSVNTKPSDEVSKFNEVNNNCGANKRRGCVSRSVAQARQMTFLGTTLC